jgi:hypothetical protein
MNETGTSSYTISGLSGNLGVSGISGCTISTGTGTTLNTNLSGYTFNPNPNKMTIRQAKVAVFTVKRNEENEVVSTKFVQELWVQVKNGGSLDLAVAKELKGDFDPETTVIREIHSFSF